jgi:hypothetical protein
MKLHSFSLVLLLSVGFSLGCIHQKTPEPLPTGWERIPTPVIEGFDPAVVTTAAKKLLGYKGAVAVIPMNSFAVESDLSEIIDGMRDTRTRGEPDICISKDARFIADAIGRTLVKFPDIDLLGLSIVVAAPNEPSSEFLALLHSRGIHYHYLHVKTN